MNKFPEFYGLKLIERTGYYQLMNSNSFFLTRYIDRLTTIFNKVNVTFKESGNVYNVVNGTVLPEKVEKNILLQEVEGIKIFKTFIDVRKV